MVDWHWIYAEAKGWQSAIGAFLGFFALVAGALINYRLGRRRDAKVREKEAEAVACALYGEIVLLRRGVARLAEAVGARFVRWDFRGDEIFDAHFAEQVALPDPRLYPQLAGRVGLLPGWMALEVVRFYALVEEARTWLPRMRDEEGRPYTYGVLYVLVPALDAVTGVVPVLRAIEEMAGIPVAEGDPETGRAVLARDMEQDRNEAAGEG